MKKKAIVFTIVVIVVILGISIMHYKSISIEKKDMRNVDEDTETNIVETTVLEDAEKNTVEYYVNNELNEAIGTVKENTEEEISFYVNNEHNASYGIIKEINDDNVVVDGLNGETFIGGNGYASNLNVGDKVYMEFNTFEEKDGVYYVDFSYFGSGILDEEIPE